MKRASGLFALVGFLLLIAGTVLAAETVTVTGELLDSKCFLSMGAKGDGHRECAEKCAAQGIPVALQDETSGKLYVLANAAGAFASYMGQKVTVTGTDYGNVIIPKSATTAAGQKIDLGAH